MILFLGLLLVIFATKVGVTPDTMTLLLSLWLVAVAIEKNK